MKPCYQCKPTGTNIYIGSPKPIRNLDMYISLGYKYSEFRKTEIKPRRSVFWTNANRWIHDRRATNRFINKTHIFS